MNAYDKSGLMAVFENSMNRVFNKQFHRTITSPQKYLKDGKLENAL